MKLKRILPIVGVASVVAGLGTTLVGCGETISIDVNYFDTAHNNVLTTSSPIEIKKDVTYKFNIDINKYDQSTDFGTKHFWFRLVPDISDFGIVNIKESSVKLSKNGKALQKSTATSWDNIENGKFSVTIAGSEEGVGGAKGDTAGNTFYTLSLKLDETETAEEFWPVVLML